PTPVRSAEGSTPLGAPGGKVGAHDRQSSRDVGRPVRPRLPQRVAMELPQLRPLVERFEIADQPAADHVAAEGDVITGAVDRGVNLTVRCLAVAEDPHLNHRPLSDLTEKLTFEIMRTVIERDHWNAAQDDGPKPLLGLLYALERGNDRAEPTGGDHGERVNEITFARSRHVRGDQVHGGGGKRTANQRR